MAFRVALIFLSHSVPNKQNYSRSFSIEIQFKIGLYANIPFDISHIDLDNIIGLYKAYK